MTLVASMIVGRRIGRSEQGIRLPPGSNLPLCARGVLLIWFGWIGFNNGILLIARWLLDDRLDMVPAHLFVGIWETVRVGLFGDPEKINTGLSVFQQLGVQALSIVAIGAYCFIVGDADMLLLNKVMPRRETKEQRMNVAEHCATTELFDLLASMQYQ